MPGTCKLAHEFTQEERDVLRDYYENMDRRAAERNMQAAASRQVASGHMYNAEWNAVG